MVIFAKLFKVVRWTPFVLVCVETDSSFRIFILQIENGKTLCQVCGHVRFLPTFFLFSCNSLLNYGNIFYFYEVRY
jgi:hypothetical protein